MKLIMNMYMNRASFLLIALVLSSFNLAGKTVSFQGNLTGLDGIGSDHIVLLTTWEVITLDLDEQNNFKCVALYENTPSYFILATSSKKGKLTRLIRTF